MYNCLEDIIVQLKCNNSNRESHKGQGSYLSIVTGSCPVLYYLNRNKTCSKYSQRGVSNIPKRIKYHVNLDWERKGWNND